MRREGGAGAPSDLGQLWRLAWLTRTGWPRFALAALLGALATGAGIGLMAVAAWLIARASQHPPVLVLEVAVVAVRALSLTRGFARYVERLVGHDAALRQLASLRGDLVARLEPLAPGGLAAFRSGDLLTRLVADVDAVQDLYLRVLLPFGAAAVVGLCTVALVGWILPAAGGVLGVSLLVVGLAVPAATHAGGRRQSGRIAAERGKLAAEVLDAMSGSRELIAYGAMDRALDSVAAQSALVRRLERSSARVAGVGGGLATAVQGLCVVGVLILAVRASQAGTLGTTGLAVVVFTAMAAFDAVAALPTAAQQVSGVAASGRRLLDVFDQRPVLTEPIAPASLPAEHAPLDVRVRGLAVRYPGSDRNALQGVDLDLPPGGRLAVVGGSGAGKSTLVAALLRLVAPTEGTVTVGGLDVANLSSEDVRTVIGGCLQDAYVFDTSVRENLLIGRREATDADLVSTLARVGLADWLQQLPNGLDTAVGRNGAKLSGGQRQRLSVARTLLADRAVLLLDEPTAGLDPVNARALLKDVLAAAQDRSVLVVTHDLVGLEAVDQVVVLRSGQLA
jgi:thiol reductant ABC exporter CydC subunit